MVQMSVGLPNIYTRVSSASESMGRVPTKSEDCCCDLLGAAVGVSSQESLRLFHIIHCSMQEKATK
jgi:hypothetical protein